MFDVERNQEHQEASLEQAEWEEIQSGYGQEFSPFVDDEEE